MVPALKSILLKSSHVIIPKFHNLANSKCNLGRLDRLRLSMKVKFSTILTFAIAAFSICFVLSANAQEEGSSLNEFQDLNQNSELNLEEDKTLIFESENKSVKHEAEVPSPNKPAVKTKSPEAVKSGNNKEEDALSFNFLYYIIQKFKYSDLLDQ
jgi:hypothetical protein